MAKAKAETTLVSELLNHRLFKPNQGRVVRQVTAIAIAVVFVVTGWRLKATILSDQSSAVGYTVFGVIAAIGIWFAFRVVNWPPFANFLVSVEAELDKVSWADWEYLKRATAVVLVTMVALGAYLFFCDVIWQWFFGLIGFLDLTAIES